MFLRYWSCQDVRSPKLIVVLHEEFGHKVADIVVVRACDVDLTVIVGHLVYLFQESVAPCDHLIFFERVVWNISIPSSFGTFIDFEESDCFEHFELIKSGRPACYLSRLIVDRPLLPRFAKYCTCKSELSRMMQGDIHLADCRPGRKAGRSDRQCSLLHRNRYA